MKYGKISNSRKAPYRPGRRIDGTEPTREEMAAQTNELIAKFLRSKKKGCTIKKIAQGRVSPQKSYWSKRVG